MTEQGRPGPGAGPEPERVPGPTPRARVCKAARSRLAIAPDILPPWQPDADPLARRRDRSRSAAGASPGPSVRPRAAEIVRRLRELYPEAAAELDYRNPFQFLIAVILSAQTTDVTVNRVTPELFRRYPTPHALAAAPQLEVEEVIRQTGFFRSKARAIRETAAQLIHDFDGEVPRTMPELLRLRGVARKTANVVLGEAFGIPSGVVVDTHVKRLAQRLGLSRATDPVKIERDLTDTLGSGRLDLRRHRRHLAWPPRLRRP